MKVRITKEWLKSRIEESGHESCEAGLRDPSALEEMYQQHTEAQEQALQELVTQAQELDMGYESND